MLQILVEFMGSESVCLDWFRIQPFERLVGKKKIYSFKKIQLIFLQSSREPLDPICRKDLISKLNFENNLFQSQGHCRRFKLLRLILRSVYGSAQFFAGKFWESSLVIMNVTYERFHVRALTNYTIYMLRIWSNFLESHVKRY